MHVIPHNSHLKYKTAVYWEIQLLYTCVCTICPAWCCSEIFGPTCRCIVTSPTNDHSHSSFFNSCTLDNFTFFLKFFDNTLSFYPVSIRILLLAKWLVQSTSDRSGTKAEGFIKADSIPFPNISSNNLACISSTIALTSWAFVPSKSRHFILSRLCYEKREVCLSKNDRAWSKWVSMMNELSCKSASITMWLRFLLKQSSQVTKRRNPLCFPGQNLKIFCWVTPSNR